ncbi:MAG: B12-binding domain-containing radical SAM protein [Lentisphaerae bacterium]|nr:B12-binding domain-containing radical SAM protein [Lentisphaerota bacterium]
MPDHADIVLATRNASYHHTSLGLRCLLANLGPLRERAALLECGPDTPPDQMAAEIAAYAPRIVGLGVYIWNAAAMATLVRQLRTLCPGAVLVLGGPELAYDVDTHPLAPLADYLISGEGERAFRDLCATLLGNGRPVDRRQTSPRLDLATLVRPDDAYTATDDLSRRVVYVETSRGCPFGCEYCLSSRDRQVRAYPLPATVAGIDALLARGAHVLKFVDRTFNLDIPRAIAILDFLRARATEGRAFQFEMVPTRFPPELRAAIRAFPPGSLRLEIGIQSMDPAVNARVGRPMDAAAVEDTLAFLQHETGAVVHADLIAGLPGETLAGLATSFNRVLHYRPRELQLGLLKHLRGTPLARHAPEWAMRFNPEPPYELRDSRHLGAADIGRLQSFAYLWERLYNRHGFTRSLPLLWEQSASAFDAFLSWTDAVRRREGRTHSLPLDSLVNNLFWYLTGTDGPPLAPERVAAALWADYDAPGRAAPPWPLRPFLNMSRQD